METRQNYTNAETPTNQPEISVPFEQLTLVQRTYIDYKAVSGLITDDDGVRKMTVEQLAQMLGVTRGAIYKAKELVPNFWEYVRARRKALGTAEKLAKIHEVWYLKAAKGDFQHLQLWLANFDPEFRMPTQKLEHEVGGGLADLLNKARERDQQQKVIEGQVSDVKPTNP